MDVVVESGNESMEVVSMILHCWFTNNEEGCQFIPPFVHCLDSLRIGPFGVWPLMRGVVSVAVGAAVLLALRRCLRHRRLKTEDARAKDTTSVEINRVDTPTRLNHSTLQLTIIPSPIKPISTSTASAAAREQQTSPVEVAKMDFTKESGEDGEDSEPESSGENNNGVEVVDTTDYTAQEVQDVPFKTTTLSPSPTHLHHHHVAVIDHEIETSELIFNLTFTAEGEDESDSDTTNNDESDSHSSITMTNPHSINSCTTTATPGGGDGVLRQRMVNSSGGEHKMEGEEIVVSKAIFAVL